MRIVLATHPIEGAEAFALQLIDEELARCIQIKRAQRVSIVGKVEFKRKRKRS